MQTTETHGGRRQGAGRPTKPDKLVRRTVYLDQASNQDIETFASRCGVTFSAVLRSVIHEYVRQRMQDETNG